MHIYAFVADDGENIHINAQALRQWCLTVKPEIFWLPMRKELAIEFLRDNVISLERVHELAQRKINDPIIMVKDGTFGANGGPNLMLVDGHHRYYIAAMNDQDAIEGHVLDVEQWKPFQIHGIPSLTKEQLRRMPVTKRRY